MRKSVFLDHVNTAAKQRSITLEEALRQVKQLGYDAVDCSYSTFRDDPIALRTMLQEVGLEVACVFGAFYLTDPSRNGELVEFFDKVVLLGTKMVLVVPRVLQPGEKTPEKGKVPSPICGLSKVYIGYTSIFDTFIIQQSPKGCNSLSKEKTQTTDTCMLCIHGV